MRKRLTFFCAALLALSVPALSVKAHGAGPSTVEPATPDDLRHALTLLTPAKGWSIASDQHAVFDAKLWSREALNDGSEIFTAQMDGKSAPSDASPVSEQKRVILRDGTNLSSVSAYALTREKTGALTEASSSIVFHKGRLYALTRCEDQGGAKGRDCLTVTRQLCEYARAPGEMPTRLSDELKVIEVRALATILALRGPDHQLENVARHGSRMGLKDALQTTKGKFLAKKKEIQSKALARARSLCELARFDREP
ncbi:MAG: hypothetical protein NDI61_14785 [Bdellovibrionaceae bacterium]|nr:hypothetical protein [Pseudobdellovibrionaceae bacterium]